MHLASVNFLENVFGVGGGGMERDFSPNIVMFLFYCVDLINVSSNMCVSYIIIPGHIIKQPSHKSTIWTR